MLGTRVLSAVMLVLIIGSSLFFGGPLWWALLLFISIIGYIEYLKAIRRIPENGRLSPAAPDYAGFFCMTAYYLILLLKPEIQYLYYTVMGAVILFMVVFVFCFEKYEATEVMAVFFGFLYIPVMISFMYLIRIRDRGLTEVLLVFISSWICDTFAYFTGVAIGRHKLAPVLSPKKSIEGAVGGTIAAALVGMLLGFLIHENIMIYGVITGVGAVISQFGDLFASGIKRNFGLKDYGTLIPGHGGILDRFDSLIIVSPVIYFLCSKLLN